MENPGLLKKLAECEYPEDFLVARLLGKKGDLPRDWELLMSSSNSLEGLAQSPFYPYVKKNAVSGMWNYLRHEHLWVYTRMNNKLRAAFNPYFIYQEIPALIKCLRCLYSKSEREDVVQHLHDSLLHTDLHDVLTGNRDFMDMLKALESCLCSRSKIFHGLNEEFEKKGMHALEMLLREKWLTYILQQKHIPKLKMFLQFMVDYHNCMALAKNIRWEMDTPFSYMKGGVIGPERFRRAHLRKTLDAVMNSFPITTTDESIPSVARLETILLSSITKQLRRWALQRTAAGTILFYLWEQFRYSRNISMLFNTVQLEDDTVSQGLIT